MLKRDILFFYNKRGQEASDTAMPVEKVVLILLAIAIAIALYLVIRRIGYAYLPK